MEKSKYNSILNDLFALIPLPIQQNNLSQQTQGQITSNNTINIFNFLSIVYWFTINLANFVIQKVVDDWYNTPAKYFQIGTNIIFAAIPIVFAVFVKNKALKTITLILGAMLSIYFLYNNTDWLIRELK